MNKPVHRLCLVGEKAQVFKCRHPFLCLIIPDGTPFTEDRIYSFIDLVAIVNSSESEESINTRILRGEKLLFVNEDTGNGVLPEKFTVTAELVQNCEIPHYLVSFAKAITIPAHENA